jgi:hypothetical protein
MFRLTIKDIPRDRYNAVVDAVVRAMTETPDDRAQRERWEAMGRQLDECCGGHDDHA